MELEGSNIEMAHHGENEMDVQNSVETNSLENETVFLSHKPETNSGLKEDESSPSKGIQSLENGKDGEVLPVPLTKSSVSLSDDSDDGELDNKMIFGRRKPIAILSDDDDDGEEENTVAKRPSILSSDEEGDGDDLFRKRIHQRPAVDSDESDSDRETPKRSPSKAPWSPLPSKPAYKYNSDLFDAELTDEENERPSSPVDMDMGKNSSSKKKAHRPSIKEREEDTRAIHSETQRMVRESELSLPYHRPKQRSLSEFLSRRKKATPPVTNGQRSIKMSMKNLETLRLLEQKKKEVEEFYKSDSDHEDPDDRDWTPGDETKDMKDNLGKTTAAVESSSGVSNENEEILAQEKPSEENPSIDAKDEKSNPTISPAEAFEEEEDLPDLIIERVPKVRVDDFPEKANDGSDETKISEEVDMTDITSGDNKISDSGIYSGTSSMEDLQSADMAVNEGTVLEKEPQVISDEAMACDEGNTLSTKDAKNNEILMDTEVNRETRELQEAVENVSLKGDKEEENLSVSEVTANPPDSLTPKLNKLTAKIPNLDLSRIAMSTPKLSAGNDDDFIDLDDDSNITPKSMSGVHDLMNRFVKHSNTKKKPAEKQKLNLSIVSKEKDAEGKEKLVSSNLVIDVEAEEEVNIGEPVPGARMVLLKSALQSKIMERREQQRLRRVKEKQFLETEQVMQDYYDDGNLPNEEDEMTDQSETDYETESEPEENDVIITDKKRKKSAYLDDEAEEDDDDDDNVADDDNDDDEADQAAVDEDSNDTVELPNIGEKDADSDEGEDGDQLKLKWEDTQDIKSDLHSNNTGTSSSVLSNCDLFASQSVKKVDSLDKDSMDSSFELFGSVIPAHQPGGGLKHRNSDRQSESENDVGFLTPLTKSKSSLFDSIKDRDMSLPIENSQDLFNTSSLTNTSINPSPCPVNLHLTPIEDSQFPLESRKGSGTSSASKLKLDFTGLETSQQEKDELMGLCSGKFTGAGPQNVGDLCDDDDLPPTQDISDLMGLCSGNFSSQPKDVPNKEFKMPAAFSSLAETEDKRKGAFEEDDELLDLCSGRFTVQSSKNESSATTNSMISQKEDHDDDKNEVESVSEPQMIIDSSDGDDESSMQKRKAKKLKKKRRRIIAFSDDEDAQDAIEYDDEENEIPKTTFTGFKDKLKGGIRADFLENEAELSESDYGVSDDEDEEGQDDLEMEEADLEKFDEDELRDQVGRAHLKTLLDSDKRELRLLQEMYLEDGELHGEGRQRQFRWKNVDADDDDGGKRFMSDEEEVDEDETEDAVWRKERFEREKFLNDQKEKAESSGAEVFKVTKKTLLRSKSLVAETTPQREPLKEANPAPMPVAPSSQKDSPNNPYSIMTKRGSFLSRDKNTLARIAELTREKGSVVGAAKQTGNFVFQQLSAEEVQKKEESTKAIKKSQSLPAAKRAKRDRSFFSMDVNSQSSSIFSQLL